MLEAAHDNKNAFTALVRRHQAALMAFFSRLGAPQEREDLTQETFIRLYRRRNFYRPTAQFTTFLYTIARSVWTDRCRKITRRERMMGYVRLDAWVKEECANDYADRTGYAEAEAALETLSPKLRETLVLSVYQGLQHKEIADVLGIPVGTVKSRLHLALSAIREILDEKKI